MVTLTVSYAVSDSISSSYHPEANRSFKQVLRSYLKCLTAEQQIIWADCNELQAEFQHEISSQFSVEPFFEYSMAGKVLLSLSFLSNETIVKAVGRKYQIEEIIVVNPEQRCEAANLKHAIDRLANIALPLGRYCLKYNLARVQ